MVKNQKKIERWFELQTQLEAIKQEELELRREIFGEQFPNPVEGSDNKVDLGGGWILQATQPYTRSVDAAVASTLRADKETRKLVDSVLDYKPSLKTREWKALTDNERVILADLVIEKPGTPSLKITFPKRKP